MTSVPPPGDSSRQQPSAPHAPPSSSFFSRLRALGVTRAPDRWIGGVAGGLAQRTGLDLALVRGLIVVLAIFGGIGVLLYGVAWALLPEPDGRIHTEEAVRGTWTSGMTGATAFVVLGLVRPGLPIIGDTGTVWTLLWVGAAGFLLYWIVNRPAGPGPRPGTPGGSDPGAPEGGPGTPGDGGPSDGGSGTSPGGTSGGASSGECFPTDSSADSSSTSSVPGDGPVSGSTSGAEDMAGSREEAGGAPRPHPLPYRPSPELAVYGDHSRYPQVRPRTGLDDAAYPSAPSHPVRARRARPSGATTALLVGVAATTAGTVLLLDRAGVLVLADATVVALATATMVLGLGVIGLGLRGRSSGFVGFAASITLLCTLVSSFAVVGGTWMVAQQGITTPSSLRVAAEGYSVLGSQSTVDLLGLPRPDRDTVVPISSLAAHVTVIVPDDVPVEVRFRSVLGQAAIEDGPTPSDTPVPSGRSGGGILRSGTEMLNTGATGAALIVDARNALGQVTVLTGTGVDPARDGDPR